MRAEPHLNLKPLFHYAALDTIWQFSQVEKRIRVKMEPIWTLIHIRCQTE